MVVKKKKVKTDGRKGRKKGFFFFVFTEAPRKTKMR